MRRIFLRLCRHCERMMAESPLGLCQSCHGTRGIRHLYEVRKNRGPAWERHLRVLARRARKRQPVAGISLAETL